MNIYWYEHKSQLFLQPAAEVNKTEENSITSDSNEIVNVVEICMA